MCTRGTLHYTIQVAHCWTLTGGCRRMWTDFACHLWPLCGRNVWPQAVYVSGPSPSSRGTVDRTWPVAHG